MCLLFLESTYLSAKRETLYLDGILKIKKIFMKDKVVALITSIKRTYSYEIYESFMLYRFSTAAKYVSLLL